MVAILASGDLPYQNKASGANRFHPSHFHRSRRIVHRIPQSRDTDRRNFSSPIFPIFSHMKDTLILGRSAQTGTFSEPRGPSYSRKGIFSPRSRDRDRRNFSSPIFPIFSDMKDPLILGRSAQTVMFSEPRSPSYDLKCLFTTERHNRQLRRQNKANRRDSCIWRLAISKEGKWCQ